MAVDGQPLSLAADGNDLWVTYEDGVQRYDAGKRQPLGGLIDVDVSDDSRMAVGLGGIWVSYPIGNTVVRIDPRTSRPGTPIRIPAGVGGPLAIGEGRLWVVNAEFSSANGGLFVTPVDERGRVGRSIRVHGSPSDTTGAIAVGGGSVWVGDASAGAIRRIDPRTHRVLPERIRLADGAAAMEFAHGALFALDGDGETLLIVDPAKAQAGGPALPVAAGEQGDIAVDDGAVWVSNLNRLSLLRLAW
jgi:streptogramin lyase